MIRLLRRFYRLYTPYPIIWSYRLFIAIRRLQMYAEFEHRYGKEQMQYARAKYPTPIVW